VAIKSFHAPVIAGGRRPDDDPVFARLLVERTAAEGRERDELAFAFDTRLRHSWAASCGRLLEYRLTGVPVSDPPDLTFWWNVRLGSEIHGWFQAELARLYPTARIELRLRVEGLDASGHADALVEQDGKTTLIELKTINGYGYKTAIGERGAPRGPRWSAVVQASLNAKAVDADEVCVVYLSLEAVSIQAATKSGLGEIGRIAAQWTWTREEYEPIAEAEIARWTKILRGVDDGVRIARKIPDPELPRGAVIVDPMSGRWERRDEEGDVIDTGTAWQCRYCSHQTHCSNDLP